MSQFGGSVNIIDPVTQSAQRGIEGTRDNLQQEANRALERAKLAAQTTIAKAQLDAELKMGEARMEHDSLMQQQQQEFAATTEGKRIAADDRRAQMQLTAQQQEAEKQRQFDVDRDNTLWQRKQGIMKSIAEEESKLQMSAADRSASYNKKLDEYNAESDDLDVEMSAIKLKRMAAESDNKTFLKDLTETATKVQSARTELYNTTLELADTAMTQTEQSYALNKTEGVAGVVTRAFTPNPGGVPGTITQSKLGADIVRGAAEWLGFDAGFDPNVINDAQRFAQELPKSLANNLQQVAKQDAGQLEPALQQFVGSLTKASFAAGSNPQASQALMQELQQATAQLQQLLPDEAIQAVVDAVASKKGKSKESLSNDKFSQSEKKNIASSFEKLGNAKGVFKSAVRGMSFARMDMDLTRSIEAIVATEGIATTPEEFQRSISAWGLSDELTMKFLESAKGKLGKESPAELDIQLRAIEKKMRQVERKKESAAGEVLVGSMQDQAKASKGRAARMMLGE